MRARAARACARQRRARARARKRQATDCRHASRGLSLTPSPTHPGSGNVFLAHLPGGQGTIWCWLGPAHNVVGAIWSAWCRRRRPSRVTARPSTHPLPAQGQIRPTRNSHMDATVFSAIGTTCTTGLLDQRGTGRLRQTVEQNQTGQKRSSPLLVATH